jgi:hypothetical protein
MKKLAILLWLLALNRPMLAQFIGFTSPQTATQQLGAASQACNGNPQDFDVQNLGQTEHYLIVVSDGHATHMRVNMFGINQNGARVFIGDQLEMANLTDGALYASGYFPKVTVEVQCTPATSIYTLTYSGVWATPPPGPPGGGNFQQTQIDKEIFNGMDGSASITYSINVTPFGSSAGALIFRWIANPVSTANVDARCASGPGTGTTWAVNVIPLGTALTNATTQQTLVVPTWPCPLLTIDYNPGGTATGSTIYLAWLFSTGGFHDWGIPTDITPGPVAAVAGSGGSKPAHGNKKN